MKKILILILFFNLSFASASSIEPDVFVQSTVNRASQILAKNISREEKINGLKIIAKETVDIKAIGFYSLSSTRKELNNDQKKMITLSHKPVIPMDLRCSATLITRRSQVQILPPPPNKNKALRGFFNAWQGFKELTSLPCT